MNSITHLAWSDLINESYTEVVLQINFGSMDGVAVRMIPSGLVRTTIIRSTLPLESSNSAAIRVCCACLGPSLSAHCIQCDNDTNYYDMILINKKGLGLARVTYIWYSLVHKCYE